jgi:DNA repair photolyase
LNKGKRADHWFWTRYSAYPYIGCQHGCEFCYCRERKYSPFDDPHDFAYIIKVKENAADLLRRALSRAPVDAIFTGDYQPAERKYRISHQMLQVCLEMGFPVFVLERSPLVTRDLDLLQAIQQRARAVVAFSIISTPESPNAARIQQIEHLAPPPVKRFAAMEKIASAGLLTGICLMPMLPEISDDPITLESIIRWTADHGGKFVLAGYLTLADQQKDFFFNYLAERQPDLVSAYHAFYPPQSYAPLGNRWRTTALRVRELCMKYGIQDRMPRPIIPGDKHATNKRLVEILAEKIYSLELDAEPGQQIWAYRKAAWAIEDLEQDISLVYRLMGLKGLQAISGVGADLAGEIERLLLNLQQVA